MWDEFKEAFCFGVGAAFFVTGVIVGLLIIGLAVAFVVVTAPKLIALVQ